jgi:hypothetical protein
MTLSGTSYIVLLFAVKMSVIMLYVTDPSYSTFPGACIIKRNTNVIYRFRNKLECLSLNTRQGWKRLPRTNTLAYYGNRKIQP